MSKGSNVRIVEISERELDGINERAEFAQRLLTEVAQEAWSQSTDSKDVKGELATLLRGQAQVLKEFLDKHGNTIRYGTKTMPFD